MSAPVAAQRSSPGQVAITTSDAEAPMVQRIEGVATMVWGIAGAMIYLTYEHAARIPDFPAWGNALLWIPGVVAGVLTSAMLWRAARALAPTLPRRGSPRAAAINSIAIVAGLGVIFGTWQPEHYGGPLLVIGALHFLFATWNPHHLSRTGRKVMAAIGVILVAGGAIASAFPETEWGLAAVVFLAGGAPFAGGMWQTLRA